MENTDNILNFAQSINCTERAAQKPKEIQLKCFKILDPFEKRKAWNSWSVFESVHVIFVNTIYIRSIIV